MSGFRPTTNGLTWDDGSGDDNTIAGWAIASGTPDVIEAAFTPAYEALVDGMEVGIRGTAANATTTPTFSPDGLPPKTITKNSGTLAAGDIVDDGEYRLRYNATLEVWKLLNPQVI